MDSIKCFQNFEMNWGPRSLMMSSGRPWCLNTSRITIFAVSSLLVVFVHGIKCAILVNRSTTVRIASKPSDGGRSVIKSREMDFHGPSGIGNDVKDQMVDDEAS